MLPFSNRLANAKFDWAGREIRLHHAPGTDYALHGFGHRKPWQVVYSSASEASLQYRHSAGDEGWPWSFEATQHVALDQDGVTVNISLTNTSPEPMPAGLGWHPFHPLALKRQELEPALRLCAQGVHDVGSDGLAVIRPSAARNAAINFDCNLFQPQTTAFEEWHGSFILPLNEEITLSISSVGCPHLVLHVPQQPGSVCVEPITLLPGALQHYDGVTSATLVALGPGQTRKMVWRCAAQSQSQAFI